jgi:glycine reductase
MVKEIERFGIPVVHIATITTICQSVGANRIVPAVAIPHPIGDPKLSKNDEYSLRRKLVKKALDALATEISGITHFE